MEQTKPPRFIFSRKVIGIAEVMKDVLDALTIGGLAGSGTTALDGNYWISALLFFATIGVKVLKVLLESTLARTIPLDPINTTDHSTVTMPDPIVVPEPITPTPETPGGITNQAN